MTVARDIIVIGGSAGAVEALLRLVGRLPLPLSATLFVTVHIPPAVVSVLPALLARAGRLSAKHPVDGEVTRRGVIYVAPPDFHLLVEQGSLRLVRGPPENGCRPAIDPLFRSAAASYGARVIGVILSGNLDDGSAGVRAIHAAGGMVVVQAPDDARYPGMARNALASVPSATVLPLDSIAAHLTRALVQPSTSGSDARSGGLPPGPSDATDFVQLDTNRRTPSLGSGGRAG